MWTWVLMVCLITLAAVAGSAACVALFVTDERRADRADRIFKTAISAATSSTGIMATVLYLQDLDVLSDLIGQFLGDRAAAHTTARIICTAVSRASRWRWWRDLAARVARPISSSRAGAGRG